MRESHETPNESSLDLTIRQVWTASARGDAEGMWERFEARYIEEEGRDAQLQRRSYKESEESVGSLTGRGHRATRSQFRRPLLLGITASLLLIAGWYTGATRVASSIASNVSVYTTNNGDRATISLPDGSTVLLNVGSKLEVPGNFAVGSRSLKLTGEALFNVKHQSGTPFTVVAGSITTRVLGTTFVIRRYETDTTVMVAVREGKVEVESEVLVESERIFVALNGVVTRAGVTEAQFSFADNVLKIEGVELSQAIHDLNRWYDVEIRLSPDSELLGGRVVQGAFAVGTPSDIASIISFMFNVRVERQGRILTVHSK